MNDLRVILLILGAVAIVALYLWETTRERRAAQRHVVRREGPSIGPEGPFISPVDPAGPPVAVGEPDEEAEEDEPSRPSAVPPEESQRIVVLHVGAPDASGFRGPAILEALEAAGLRFGPMRIFHSFGAGVTASESPLFSVASMQEPGYLDPELLDDHFVTRGLTLFMCVPAPVSSMLVFDLMVDTARALAAALGGRVLGQDRSEADDAALEAIRRTLA